MYAQTQARRPALVTVLAIAACVYIFIAVNSNPTEANLNRLGALDDFDLYQGQWWGLITSAFVHIEPLHLMFNMYWLWILGGAFESRFGPFMMLGFIAITAFVSGGLQFAISGSGIGMSGVGYALFGFGWASRAHIPEFARVVSNQVVQLFMIWGVICIITTQLGLMNIGNVAHFGGLAVGAALAVAFSESKWQMACTAAVVVLAALAITPLYWNPLSVDWVSLQALKAQRAQKWDEALRHYDRSLEMGQDPIWVLDGKARVHGFRGDEVKFNQTLFELERLDRTAADKVRRDFALMPLEDNKTPTED